MNSYYVYSPNWTWANYLQAQSFERSIKGQISTSSREIIGTTEQLQREGIDVVRQLHSTVKTGFEEVSWRLAAIRQSVEEVNATLVWGFSSLTIAVDKVSDALDELIRIGRNPNKNQALEYFKDAEHAFAKGWHQEAFKLIRFALEGDGKGPGYELDFRFHNLLGQIRLGNVNNQLPAIINPSAAEKAFLDAVRFAEHDMPPKAAFSALCAGVSAYNGGAFQRAIKHLDKALGLNAQLAEAHFQKAKVLMHINQPINALPPLKEAILLHRNYMSRAEMDGDFQRHNIELDKLLAAMRDDAKRIAKTQLTKTLEKAAKIKLIKIDTLQLVDLSNETMRSANAYLRIASKEFNTHTYLGYVTSAESCESATTELNEAFIKFKEVAGGYLEQMIRDHENDKQSFSGLWGRTTIIIGSIVIAICVLICTIAGAFGFDNPLFGILAGVLGGLFAGALNAIIIAPILSVIIASFRNNASSANHSKRLAQLQELRRKIAHLARPI